MASAAFTIDGTAVPTSAGTAVQTDFATSVSLAVVSTTGAKSIEWSILGTSAPTVATPTITRTGTPLGATATFATGADPGDGSGLGYGVRCKVTDGGGTVTYAYGVVGVPAAYDEVPQVVGEELWRHATHGWTPYLNSMALGFPHTTGQFTTTDATAATAATVAIPTGKLIRISSIWSAVDATSGDRLYREATAFFQNDAGTVTQKGSDVDVLNDEDDASWAATFSISGTNVLVRYQGDATNSVDWRVFVWAMRVGN